MEKTSSPTEPSSLPLMWIIIGAIVALLLAFGFGYFFGRYEQIQLYKTLLKPISDVNALRK